MSATALRVLELVAIRHVVLEAAQQETAKCAFQRIGPDQRLLLDEMDEEALEKIFGLDFG